MRARHFSLLSVLRRNESIITTFQMSRIYRFRENSLVGFSCHVGKNIYIIKLSGSRCNDCDTRLSSFRTYRIGWLAARLYRGNDARRGAWAFERWSESGVFSSTKRGANEIRLFLFFLAIHPFCEQRRIFTEDRT